MAKYRFLQDHYVNGCYWPAGTVASTADVVTGPALPTNWVPTPNVDPLDTAAVNAFYAAGPNKRVFQFGTLSFQVAPPATYWIATPQPSNPSVVQFTLSGLGSGKAPVFYANGTGGNG
jgi:hypothetical protein